ncbi:imidazoleglycerol-phosphate dehydratase HisB [Natronogracilivirga saccharolytica]|nr:imidazoleglycerol-phosphate dehydratase HisB [Natronogracilivirga saccharolytica]
MAIRSLLIIDSEALAPDREGFLMRSGSIVALRKLFDSGIQPAGNPDDFGEHVAELLYQENIQFVNAYRQDDLLKNCEIIRVFVSDQGKLLLETPERNEDQDPSHPGTAGPDEYYSGLEFDGWEQLAAYLLGGYRTASHSRKTGETDISIKINLDGSGESHIDTGLPFYDHMLEQIARHGYMDIDITCKGDLEIDEHHTIEDTAIALGEAIGMALGDKRGIGRYGFVTAMDETRSLVAIDLSGRPWFVFEGEFRREKVGDFPTEMTSHFFHSLAMALQATLHVAVRGENDHHKIEACFKALARSLRQAVDRNENYRDILPSSKGLL